jgi:hypothetical protein
VVFADRLDVVVGEGDGDGGGERARKRNDGH